MKKRFVNGCLVIIAVVFMSFKKKDLIPMGWFKAGSAPKKYIVGIDSTTQSLGSLSAYIESKKEKTGGFGTLMQTCSARDYLGKRVKMSGFLKTKNVVGWTGLWFRIDAKYKSGSLSFDNMEDRKITGTNEWKKYEIVLDVPKESGNMNFGVLLEGTGKVWIDAVTFEVVSKSTPLTSGSKVYDHPSNLNFEGVQ